MPVTYAANDNKAHTASNNADLLYSEILNHYQTRLFLLCENLLKHVTIAQKNTEGQISWVELDVPFHSHMIKVVLALFDKPSLPMAKQCSLLL